MLEELKSRPANFGWDVLLPNPQLVLEDVQSVGDFGVRDADSGGVIVHQELQPDVLADMLDADVLAEELVGREGGGVSREHIQTFAHVVCPAN